MSEERRITDPFRDDLHNIVNNVTDMKNTLVRIEEKLLKVDDHHRTLYGINGQPGLTIVVDRLNEMQKSRGRNLLVIYSTISGLVVKTLWDMIVKGK